MFLCFLSCIHVQVYERIKIIIQKKIVNDGLDRMWKEPVRNYSAFVWKER
jgi:hypothetical protein